jgi:hypothetical protein
MTLDIEGPREGISKSWKQGFQIFDFSTEVGMKIAVFWDAASCI